MRRYFLAVTLFVLTVSFSTSATDWYVSPTGSPSNAGTLASPWDLQTALNGPGSIQPGDNIWLLPGTYIASNSSGFASFLNGTSSSPIVLRNYQGGRATLNGFGDEFVLAVYGQYTWFWGIEFMDSNTQRVTSVPGSTGQPNAFGPSVYGPGNKLINCVIHDTAEGISAYNASPNSEFTGNLIYYNGWIGPDRVHGNGLYMQNVTGTKLVLDNIIGDNSDNGIEIYGSGGADLTGITVQGSSLYNTASWLGPTGFQYNIVMGNGLLDTGNAFDSNYSYFTLSARAGFVSIGQFAASNNISATNNVFAGGYINFAAEGVGSPFTFTGNSLVNIPADSTFTPLNIVRLGQFAGQSLSGYTWDRNSYYGLNDFWGVGTYGPDANLNYGDVGGTNNSFSAWQALTGFDAHSTYTNSLPASNWVFVRPNKYEQKRANITIYNWQNLSSIAVDLSSILSVGDQFVIQDAQNVYGSPVASGTYSGGAVSIPMTGTKASPIGFSAPPSTEPQFGVFVLMVPGSGTNSQPPSSPSPLVITTTSLPGGTAGTSYSTQLAASGGTAPYSFVVTGLPANITASSQGLISGTPTAAGTSTVLVTVTDSHAATAQANFSLTISTQPQPLAITTTSLPGGTAGTSYSAQLAASGGTAPYSFVVSGLPANLSFTPQGSISGTPTAAGTSTISVTVTDSHSATAQASFSLVIAAQVPPPPVNAPLTVTPQTLSNGVVGQAYSTQLVATGGTAPYRWVFVGGVIPPGLGLSSAGLLNGTPQSATGVIVFYVYVYDSAGAVVTNVPFTITVTSAPTNPPPTPVVITTTSLPGGTVGTVYSAQLIASGGTAPYTFAVSGLPANLSFSSQGMIAGTPAAAGTSTVTVTATDAHGATGSASLNLVIAAQTPPPPPPPTGGPLTVAPQALSNGVVGRAYSTQLVATGGTAPYRWIFVGGVIPPGLGLSSSGLLSGTPQSATGLVVFYVYVYDSAGAVVTDVPFTLTVTN